jgi:hypothetical protein
MIAVCWRDILGATHQRTVAGIAGGDVVLVPLVTSGSCDKTLEKNRRELNEEQNPPKFAKLELGRLKVEDPC